MRCLFIILLLAFPVVSQAWNDSANKPKSIKATSFSQQLGLAAISIPEQVKAQHETIILSYYDTNDDHFQSNTSYKRAGHWFYQNKKANVWLGRLISNNVEFPEQLGNTLGSGPQGLNAAFNYGRFSMETALITDNSNIKDSGKFYLQGAYTLIEKSSFNIAITAKVETLSEHNVNYYFGNKTPLEQSHSLIDYQAKNTTLGVVGTYELSSKWTVIGAFTSTMLDKDIMQSPLVSDNNLNMALIGTSYSF